MKSDAQVALDNMSRDDLETAIQELSTMVATREQRIAELEGYLQQAKDDYEVALRETEKLRALYAKQCSENLALQGQSNRLHAGLEKVREVAKRLRLIADRYKGSWDALPGMLRELAGWLAKVDHG